MVKGKVAGATRPSRAHAASVNASSIQYNLNAANSIIISNCFKIAKPPHVSPKVRDATLSCLPYMYTNSLGHKKSNTIMSLKPDTPPSKLQITPWKSIPLVCKQHRS